MASIKSLPIEVVRKIIAFLDTRDEMSAAEALPLFDAASDLQLETSTDLKILPKKKTLVVIVSETDCKTAISMALLHYEEVHLILCRSLVEKASSDSVYFLRRWLEELTADGVMPFKTIEMVGRMASCGCGFSSLTRYA